MTEQLADDNPSSITSRARDYTLWAHVAPDTVDVIAYRIRNLLADGRRFTAVRELVSTGRVDTRQPDVDVSLRLDHGFKGNGLHVWKDQGVNGCGFTIGAAPGLHYFSAAGYHRSESAARMVSGRNPGDHETAYVTITGGQVPGEDTQNRDDRIIAEYVNRDGVLNRWIIAPHAPAWADQ